MLGFFEGLTYKGVQTEGAVLSNCFYSAYNLVKNGDEILYIFENAANDSGSYKWYQWAVEEPVKFALNTTVTYQ